MSFSQSVTNKDHMGNKQIYSGTYNCASVTTGELRTGLSRVDYAWLVPKASGVAASQPVINETFPVHGDLTLITASGQVGYWFAVGI